MKVLICSACVLGVFTAGHAYAQNCVQRPPGLIAWWDGDNVTTTTAFDIQGTNDGSLINGVLTSSGRVGNAFSFNGVNQFIDVGNPPSLDPAGQSELTVDAWVYPAALQNNFATIIDKRDETVGNGGTQWIMQFQLAGDNRRPEFAVVTDTGAAFAQSPDDLTANAWHHLAGVYDGSTVRLYVNGVLKKSVPLTGAIKTFSAPSPTITIGAFDIKPTGFKSFFTGLIDEVEIFNRALSSSEIQAIFNAGQSGKCKTQVAIDIKPGSFPNSINLGSKGVTPVAIFSTATFDATQVDPLTVTLADAVVKVKGNGTPQASIKDVDGDGLLDLVVHMETEGFQLTSGDEAAFLAGAQFDGTTLGGSDSVRIVP